MKPLVSVLMAAYKAEKYIGEAIESVINSHYSNWELIIVDDKSPDNTLGVAREYETKDSRIKVYVNEVNLGDYPNRNKVASLATGKYLKYLDNDDVLYHYSLDYMVDAMENEPAAGLAIGFSIIDDDKPYPILKKPVEVYKDEFLNKGFLGYGPSAAIIRHEVFKEFNGFSGKVFVGDQELWLKIGAMYPIIKLQPALIWYRSHPEQESKRERKDLTNYNIRFKICKDALEINKNLFSEEEYLYATKKMKRNYARLLCKNILTPGQTKAALKTWKSSGLSFIELTDGFKGYIP